MKKLFNKIADIVPEMLEGIVALAPGSALLEGEMVVVDFASAAARASGRVALVSGGGAGHEPAHAGYVGAGMLSAAVSGDVFTSPSTDAVLAAIHAVTGPAGVLLLVKNYTGDRLNFGLAAELARAEGLAAEMVVIGDDVALDRDASHHAGRRGLAGTVLVHKIAGAAAMAGLSLAAVRAEAEAAAASVGTMGVALGPCIVPAAGRAGFTLGENEIELGLGIHGEPGVRREALRPADMLVEELLGRIIEDQRLVAEDRVALLVNNLGGTTTMEMAIVARKAVLYLAGRGIRIERAWSGALLTALEMPGFSLSVMRVDDARLARLQAATTAPAWPASHLGAVQMGRTLAAPSRATPTGPVAHSPAGDRLRDVILAMAAAAVAAEPLLTRLDQEVGDGDLGISLARGAAAVRRDLPTYALADPASTLRGLSDTLRRALGGTSGPLYAVFLLRAAAAVEGAGSVQSQSFALAMEAGCKAVAELGGAQEGDCTMLDALLPASRALREAVASGQPLQAALAAMLAAAEQGRTRTAQMAARRGRTSYLGSRALGHVDPGAEAVVVLLRALVTAQAE